VIRPIGAFLQKAAIFTGINRLPTKRAVLVHFQCIYGNKIISVGSEK
jgi:hypothetical protein